MRCCNRSWGARIQGDVAGKTWVIYVGYACMYIASRRHKTVIKHTHTHIHEYNTRNTCKYHVVIYIYIYIYIYLYTHVQTQGQKSRSFTSFCSLSASRLSKISFSSKSRSLCDDLMADCRRYVCVCVCVCVCVTYVYVCEDCHTYVCVCEDFHTYVNVRDLAS